MPTRVDKIHWRVVDVRVAIQTLHAGRDDHVRLGHASEVRVIPAGVVPTGGFALEHQAEVGGVAVLTGVGVVCWRCACIVSHLTPGGVAQFGDDISADMRTFVYKGFLNTIVSIRFFA